MLVNLACWVAVVLGAESGRLPNFEAELHAGRPASVEIPAASELALLSVAIALTQPGRLRPATPIAVKLEFGETTLKKAAPPGRSRPRLDDPPAQANDGPGHDRSP